MEFKSEFYTDIEETLKKYDLPYEAKEDVEETLQKMEDYIVMLTIGLT